MGEYIQNHASECVELFIQHCLLSLSSVILAFLIALPVAYFLSNHKKYASIIFSLYGFIYVIPSIALFALLIPIFGLGWIPVFIALVLYSQVSLTRSCYTAFCHVGETYGEITNGLGLPKGFLFIKIQFPLALPIIIGGLRVTTLNMIAIATIGAFMNAGGLGVLIFEGLNQNNVNKMALGTGMIMFLSLGIHVVFKGIEGVVSYKVDR